MVERAIERANAIARELNDDHVGTQHLLLALITEPQSVAAGMYADLGIGESEFRDQLAGMNVAPQSVD
jgi:ATP-dependent Clp protease ATP-binding subunit ClpA